MSAMESFTSVLRSHPPLSPYGRMAGQWPHGGGSIHEAATEINLTLLQALQALTNAEVKYTIMPILEKDNDSYLTRGLNERFSTSPTVSLVDDDDLEEEDLDDDFDDDDDDLDDDDLDDDDLDDDDLDDDDDFDASIDI